MGLRVQNGLGMAIAEEPTGGSAVSGRDGTSIHPAPRQEERYRGTGVQGYRGDFDG